MNVVRIDSRGAFYISKSTIFVPVYNTSAVIVDTETFVAFNHLDWNNDARASWWFFIEVDGIMTKIPWEQLTLTQQVQVRTGVVADKRGIMFRAELFPYSDERCYILEALSGS